MVQLHVYQSAQIINRKYIQDLEEVILPPKILTFY